ncbi:MAG: class I SAM-dependent methyltransferase [Thermoanaerobaculia bacterium]|nr:class I SAM-dependent methyltransferase [Thermoanaerobaculia bacterium]
MPEYPIVRLKRGRESSVVRRHPWIFSGAVATIEGSATRGQTVDVVTHDGRHLGLGAVSPPSQIRVRMWTMGENERDVDVDQGLFARRLDEALELRAPLLREPRGGCRLVYSESDRLPGVIVDRYADVLVVQFLSEGAERWRDTILDALEERLAPATIWERSDADVRAKEGLRSRTGLARGEEPPALLEIDEGGVTWKVDVRSGHKTGFYLDQRENRAAFVDHLRRHVLPDAPQARVLNAFAYTGGFGVLALSAGAGEVVQVEASKDCLRLGRENVEANDLDRDRLESVEGNVFSELRRFRSEGRRFDVVVLDPPKFVEHRKHVDRAARGYKDINLLACQLLAPGGTLVTFSCSGLLETELFQKIVADAALDAGREARVVRRLSQSEDHPVHLAFPEASYLKGLICRLV